MLPPPGFEPQVRAERQDGFRACGLGDFRETTEDRRRRPQAVNPEGVRNAQSGMLA